MSLEKNLKDLSGKDVLAEVKKVYTDPDLAPADKEQLALNAVNTYQSGVLTTAQAGLGELESLARKHAAQLDAEKKTAEAADKKRDKAEAKAATLEGELKAERAVSASALADAAAERKKADDLARNNPYTSIFATPQLAQAAKDQNHAYGKRGTPAQIEADQHTLSQYKSLGTYLDLAKIVGEQGEYAKLGTLDDVKKMAEQHAEYAKLGTPADLTKKVDEHADYAKHGTPDDVKKKTDEHAEYVTLGNPVDVKKKTEEHADYAKLGTPTDLKKKADEHAEYAKLGTPADAKKKATDLDAEVIPYRAFVAKHGPTLDDIEKKLAAIPAPGGKMPDPTPPITDPADPAAAAAGAIGTADSPSRLKQAGFTALFFASIIGAAVGVYQGYQYMTKKDGPEQNARPAAPLDPKLLEQLGGRVDNTETKTGALENRVTHVEQNTNVLPALTLQALKTDAATYFLLAEQTACARYESREYQLLNAYRALAPAQRGEKLTQLRTDLAALDSDYAKLAKQVREAKFTDAAVMQFNTTQYLNQHRALVQYLDRAILAFGSEPLSTARPGLATELLNLNESLARIDGLETRMGAAEGRLNSPSAPATAPAAPVGSPALVMPAIPAGLSLEQARIRGYITAEQYNAADRARRK